MPVRVMLLFIDGVGLGGDDPAINPLLTANMPHMRSLLGGRPLARASVPVSGPPVWAVVTDPSLGVPGLPQSATGQTTIFTGANAAQAIGRHLNAYPTPNLKAILNERSIFKQVEEAGLTATFLNAYSPRFFEWMEAGFPRLADRRYSPSASTVGLLASGFSFRSFADLEEGRAVFHDIDHHTLAERGHPEIARVEPEEAGRRAAALAAEYHFTLYEHFLTDFAGHSREMGTAIATLERVDRFLGGLLAHLDPGVTLVITSDHGNIEDLSVKTHTMNPVATICLGPGAEAIASRVRDLTDITPAVMAYLTGTNPGG